MTLRPPAPIVAFRGVSKIYGEGTGLVRALDGVTVDIAAGQFTAVMGPSGSGKSTFMNLAAGLDDPTSGEVWVAGQPLHALDDDARTVLRRTHVGFVFQAFNLVPTLSAIENVLLPFELAGRRLTADERAWVDTLMRSLGLADRAGTPAGRAVGRAAAARRHRPRAGVAAADRGGGRAHRQPRHRHSREVLSLLRTAAREYQQTIAMVSHDPVAASYADRILVIADGRIVGDHPSLPPQEIAELLISLEVAA